MKSHCDPGVSRWYHERGGAQKERSDGVELHRRGLLFVCLPILLTLSLALACYYRRELSSAMEVAMTHVGGCGGEAGNLLFFFELGFASTKRNTQQRTSVVIRTRLQ